MNFTIHAKEKRYLIAMILASLCIYYFILANIGVRFYAINVVLVVLGYLCYRLIMSLLLVGNLKGNSIKIQKNQFPEIFEILQEHSNKLGLPNVPEMYLLQGNGILNAFAYRFAKNNYVIVHSDVLEVAYQEGLDAVSFIVGHELGHIKRNHTSFLKSIFILPAQCVPLLAYAYSRSCEYTCDNIGYNLAPNGAIKGILILAAGKKLYNKINVTELISNAEMKQDFAVTFAETLSTHPMLLSRIAVINQLNRENLTPESFVFRTANFEPKQAEMQQ